MSLDRVRFYLIRLKRASLAETMRRLREATLLQALTRVPFLFAKDLAPPEVDPRDLEGLKLPELASAPGAPTADEILAGRVFTLGFATHEIKGFEKRFAGVSSPNVRQGPQDPDIRAVWEPARLQHLTIVLDEISRTSEPGRALHLKEFVADALMKWLADNPFMRGPHYMCVMECGLRILALLLALARLDNLSHDQKARLLDAIFKHAWLTEKRLSLYSSLGNHTTTEALGLLMAGAVFRADPRGRRWIETGIRLLNQECRHQILDDGGPVEQSPSYHRFVLDVFLLAARFMEANKLHDCAEIESRLALGETFYHFLSGCGGEPPLIGDSDDGHAAAPGLHPAGRKNRAEKQPGIKVFEQAGYTVIHGRGGEFLTFDHGPLGMAPLYNHGHADALSVTACLNGKPLLVDPGTYRYNGATRLRRWFKGTPAHNTVTVDNKDQAEQLTSFIWRDGYKVKYKIENLEQERVRISAAHDGYQRLSSPISHLRIFSYQEGSCLLIDQFEGHGSHSFALNYILHPHVGVEKAGEWLRLCHDGQCMFLAVLGRELEIVAKEDEKAWYSKSYGMMEPTLKLTCGERGPAASVRFLTLMHFGPQTELGAVLAKFDYGN